MALRRLLVAHIYLRAAGTIRTAKSIAKSERIHAIEKPLCPGNAFTLFLETQPRDGKTLKIHVYEVACKWNTLSLEEKQVFQQKAKELEERYQKEISEWEVRMQQLDYGDLVERQRQLTDDKNLAIKRSRQAISDLDQDSILTMGEEKESPFTEKKEVT